MTLTKMQSLKFLHATAVAWSSVAPEHAALRVRLANEFDKGTVGNFLEILEAEAKLADAESPEAAAWLRKMMTVAKGHGTLIGLPTTAAYEADTRRLKAREK